jgi:hypothetical protein
MKLEVVGGLAHLLGEKLGTQPLGSQVELGEFCIQSNNDLWYLHHCIQVLNG